MLNSAEFLATIEAIRDAKPRPRTRLVHPRVYEVRQSCPLWTNRPNQDHEHVAECDGTNDWTV